MIKKIFNKQGEALITLLVFVIVGMSITAAGVALIVSVTKSASEIESSSKALYLAESGAENGVLRLLRNPNYSGETVLMGDGSTQITVVGGGAKTLTSTGNVNGSIRKVEVQISYTNNVITVNSWKETY